MPETKNKTLEEIDLLFQKPTREIVAENMKNMFKFGQAERVSDPESEVNEKVDNKETQA